LIPAEIEITWKGFVDDGEELVSQIVRRSFFNSSNPTVEDLKREATENPSFFRMSYKSEERWSVQQQQLGQAFPIGQLQLVLTYQVS
jgi:hypothetical protein